MGIVYRCLDHANNLPVALKTLKQEYLSNRYTHSIFLREGSIWVQLGKHQNIVRCYKIKIVPETEELFFILELILKEDGRSDASLRSWLVNGSYVSMEIALLFGLQIARGMKYAVTKFPGLVHRDLKPENILVGADKIPGGEVNHLYITDFGLAKSIQETLKDQKKSTPTERPFYPNSLTHHTMLNSGIVGTPIYMAPEQWLNKNIGPFTDIFAFGCILYEMLTGRTLNSGTNIEQIRHNCLYRGLVDFPKFIPQIIKVLVNKSLELNPNKRYSNWMDLEESIITAYEKLLGNPIPSENESLNKEMDEQIQIARSFNALGIAYIKIGKLQEARDNINKAIVMSKEISRPGIEIHGRLNLAAIYSQEGNYTKATSIYMRALSFYRKREDHKGEAIVIRKIGGVYTEIGEYKKAITFFQEAANLADEFSDMVNYLDDLLHLGTLKKYIGDTTGAIKCFEESAKIANSIGNKSGEAGASIGLGIIYKNQGEFDNALRFHGRALNISQNIGNRHIEMSALVNLGITYKNIGEFNKAVEIYKTVLPITRELKDKNGEASVLCNLGRVYQLIKEPNLSIFYLNQALELSRQIGNKHGELTSIGIIGNSLILLGDINGAKLAYKTAINLAQEVGDIIALAENNYDLAILLANLGEFQEAKEKAELAVEFWKNMGSYRYQHGLDLLKNIQRYYF
ncbi:MAG: tetratricopeptide repeat protein [Candidatus Helarchaeota archaeon]